METKFKSTGRVAIVTLLLMAFLTQIVHTERLNVTISYIQYACVNPPCILWICVYPLPSLSMCPIRASSCTSTNCRNVRSDRYPINDVNFNLIPPSQQQESILNIKVSMVHQIGPQNSCGSIIQDSCWDFTYTNGNLMTNSKLSYQVQILKTSESVSTPPTSTGTITRYPRSTDVTSTVKYRRIDNNNGHDHFPSAAAFGIALACLVVIIILILVICLCCHKKKRKETVVAVVDSPPKQAPTKQEKILAIPYEEYEPSQKPTTTLTPISHHGYYIKDGSETSSYHIEMEAEPTKKHEKKKRRKKRKKSNKDIKKEIEYEDQINTSTDRLSFHASRSDTFYINARTQSYSGNDAPPMEPSSLETDYQRKPRRHRKKRKSPDHMQSYDGEHFVSKRSEPHNSSISIPDPSVMDLKQQFVPTSPYMPLQEAENLNTEKPKRNKKSKRKKKSSDKSEKHESYIDIQN